MPDDPGMLTMAMIAAICIGLSKAGFSGISMVSVVILAEIYGPKPSVGLALPLLIAADLMAYPAFLKHGSWKPVWKLLPATVAGLLIGWWLLDRIEDPTVAKRVIGACVMLMVLLQALKKFSPGNFAALAESRSFGTGAGVLGGFSTMLANAAGPVIQLYFLAKRLPKMEMIGIGARFFLLVNLLKVPMNAGLSLIHPGTLMENAKLMPGVIAGLVAGRWLIGRVPQEAFEWMIVVFSFVAAVRLLIF